MKVNLLAELTRAECMALLRTVPIGRAVYTDEALPVCSPVAFIVDGSSLVFRTREGSRIASSVLDAVIAFEADDYDATTHAGWSVLVTGTATVVRDSATIARLEDTSPPPWVVERTCWIRIVPTLVRGHHLLRDPQPLAASDRVGS